MRTLEESREEFNEIMNPYIAVIVQKEKVPFDDNFFSESGLIIPDGRIKYTPPVWAGARYTNEILRKGKAMNLRYEKIPQIDPNLNYLVCDEYSSKGETFEIAIIRLLDQGASLENIWCLSNKGNREFNDVVKVLDTGLEWHNYRARQIRNNRKTLQQLGYSFPEFPVKA